MASVSWTHYHQRGKRKRYLSYDQYIDNTLGVMDEEDYVKIGTFKAKNNIVCQASYGNLSWEYNLIGHILTKINYSVLSEMGKRVILSLLKAVEEHIASGFCFKRFKWPEIALTREGQILFKHVEIIPSSPNARKNTVADAVRVIEYLVKPKNTPADLVHLLRLMDHQVKSELYTIHASLVPLNNRGWAYIQMYEKVKGKISVSQFRNILLKIPYHSNWRVQVQQNLVLQETYDYVQGRYDSRPGNKTALEEQVESAELFLDFLRNGTSHRAQRTLISLPTHFELIVFVLFPLLLPLLQEAIYDELPDGLIFLQGVFKPLMSSS